MAVLLLLKRDKTVKQKKLLFSALTKFKFCLLNSRVYRTNASLLSAHWVYSHSHEEYFFASFLAYPDCLECGGSWNPRPDQ